MFGIEEELEFKPIDPADCLKTMEEWIANVEAGGFIDYDGFGLLATTTTESNIDVKPSQVKDGKLPNLPEWATHVLWFNK